MLENKTSSADGFTLLEMIVAFFILSTSLVVATQALGLASKSAVSADEREAAIELVQIARLGDLDSSGRLIDSNGRQWTYSVRRVGNALPNAHVFAFTLISPRGSRFGFLIPYIIGPEETPVGR
ncbi:hypothetical protein N185_15810 [Sinorhizobium sp. GW3]|nr:hypothetical protein N185_15810 [Sinorhizobium sp. GW3]